MKNLKDYEWKPRYSGKNDLLNDFYIPALTRSKFYYRTAGYFRSSALAVAFKGVSAFIENGEKMFLIVGADMDEKDVEAIQSGELNTNEVLIRNWENCKKEFDSNIIKKRFELLSWMIANNKLEIKVGINKGPDGKYLPTSKSYFHQKVMVFEDFEGNKIQLDGSINETSKALTKNNENFAVHKSWINDHIAYVNDALSEFNTLWIQQDSFTEILSIPEAIKKELIDMSPKNLPNIKDEIDLEEHELNHINSNPIDNRKLKRHQTEAIQAWKDNHYQGILEMATGTGKTFTALKAISELELSSKFLVIAVPQKELAIQWEKECQKTLTLTKRILICNSDNPKWKKIISRYIRQTKSENTFCVIIIVLASMRNNMFLDEINKIQEDTYLIIDEVHEAGSHQNRLMFKRLEGIKYRLGLSATPTRLWDNEGNSVILNYFGGHQKPIFEWDMLKAINPPEGYDKSLCSYKYHLFEAHLDDEELKKYLEISDKIKKKIAILTNGGKIPIGHISDEKSLTTLLNQRADIIKECKDNHRVLLKILDLEKDQLKKCLIYCNDKLHMKKVSEELWEKGFRSKQYDGDLKIEIKQKILDSFKNEDLQFIVAIKCLDQGVDIPICDSAIILASSRNPRQYIQRRGRILRLYEGKEYANIYDIIVFPYPVEDLTAGKSELFDYEMKILENQIDRIKIFIENSDNKHENYIKLLTYDKIRIKK